MDDVKKNGGQAILTKKKHKTGTDRIYEALQIFGSRDIDLIMNLQGDEPLINIQDIRNLNNHMKKNNFRLGTLASNISEKKLFENKDIVKVFTKESLDDTNFPEAVDFLRLVSKQNKNIYHHLGIYCYQAETLKNFTSLSQTQNELDNKLEQLRALDNGIKINVALAKSYSIGIDTEEDFLAIKKFMEYKT